MTSKRYDYRPTRYNRVLENIRYRHRRIEDALKERKDKLKLANTIIHVGGIPNAVYVQDP